MDRVLPMDYEEYIELGFSLVPEGAFPRHIMAAFSSALAETLGRINIEWFTEPEEENAALVDRNKIGLCELADQDYRLNSVAVGETGTPIISFRNESYEEKYVSAFGLAESRKRELKRIMSMYFSSEQLSRAMGMPSASPVGDI